MDAKFSPLCIFLLLGLFLQLIAGTTRASQKVLSEQKSMSKVKRMPVLADLEVKDLEVDGNFLTVWFQNNGLVYLGKSYRIKVVIDGKTMTSEPLKMLGTNELQGYAFNLNKHSQKNLKLKKAHKVFATIDYQKKIRESDEKNLFTKYLVL